MDGIGDRVRKRREELRLTQAQLAHEAGVRQSTIGNIEAGLRKRPRESAALAKALKVDRDWLETGKSEKPSKAAPDWVGHAWGGPRKLTKAQESLWKAVLLFLEELSDEQSKTTALLITSFANPDDVTPKMKRKAHA